MTLGKAPLPVSLGLALLIRARHGWQWRIRNCLFTFWLCKQWVEQQKPRMDSVLGAGVCNEIPPAPPEAGGRRQRPSWAALCSGWVTLVPSGCYQSL